jgi:hypothetical protein
MICGTPANLRRFPLVLKFGLLGRADAGADKYHSNQDKQKKRGQQEQNTQNNGLDYAAQSAKQSSGHRKIPPECCRSPPQASR